MTHSNLSHLFVSQNIRVKWFDILKIQFLKFRMFDFLETASIISKLSNNGDLGQIASSYLVLRCQRHSPWFGLTHYKSWAFYRTLPAWEFKDYLGWMEQGDGKLAYGVFVQNGRIKGDAKKALRQVIERYELPVIITPNQNLVLTEIEPSWKTDILTTLANAGVRWIFCISFPFLKTRS